VPLPRKFMNFSSQNGVRLCILGVLFLRFMCPMDCSCMINFTEVDYQFVPNERYRLANSFQVSLKEKNKTLVKILGVVNTGRLDDPCR